MHVDQLTMFGRERVELALQLVALFDKFFEATTGLQEFAAGLDEFGNLGLSVLADPLVFHPQAVGLCEKVFDQFVPIVSW